jgi:hypothetical protein
MSEIKANHIPPTVNVGVAIAKGIAAGAAFQLDVNTEVIAKGVIITSKAGALKSANDLVNSLTEQLGTAHLAQNNRKKEFVLGFNLGTDKANEIYPHSDEDLSRLKMFLSKAGTTRPVPGKITGGSLVQSEHSGMGYVHFNYEANTDEYILMETQSTDITNEEVYYPANPIFFSDSRGGEVTPKTKGVNTTYRIFGRNTTGDGFWSDPFGGFPIH